MRAYYVPDVVEDQSFIHFPPKYILSIYNTAGREMEIQPLAIHKFVFFTECLLCAGEMEDWLFIHFSKNLLHSY